MFRKLLGRLLAIKLWSQCGSGVQKAQLSAWKASRPRFCTNSLQLQHENRVVITVALSLLFLAITYISCGFSSWSNVIILTALQTGVTRPFLNHIYLETRELKSQEISQIRTGIHEGIFSTERLLGLGAVLRGGGQSAGSNTGYHHVRLLNSVDQWFDQRGQNLAEFSQFGQSKSMFCTR